MTHNQSAHMDVEGDIETPLLGRNTDDSTTLSQHDNVCIRVPVRIVRTIKDATVGTPGRLTMSLVLLGGMSLALVAATSQTFHPMLVIVAALIFILSAIIFRLNNTRF